MFMRSDQLTIYLSCYSSLKLYFIYMVMLYGSLNHFGSFYSYPNISSYCVVVTLKVKSGDSIESTSPTLALLRGSTSWPVITSSGAMETVNVSSCVGIIIRATSSIWHISELPAEFTTHMCESAVMMCLAVPT